MANVAREISISEARDELTSLPEALESEPGAVAVTRRGRPVLAVMSWDLYESIVETLEIMADKDLIASLRVAIEEVMSGDAIPWERAKKEL